MAFSRLLIGTTLAALTLNPAALLAEIIHEGPSVSIPADMIMFGPTGVKTETGELFAGPAYGDLTSGKHGTFIRGPAGYVSPEHVHTEDYFGIVIKGIAANGPVGSTDVALPAGSYWFQRGEENHVTKCISDEDCLFFIYQPGAFDFAPAK